MTRVDNAAGVGGITGDVGTAFGSATTVNSGSGHQLNLTVVGEESLRNLHRLLATEPLRRGRGVISAQEVRRIAACFVQPPGFPHPSEAAVQYFTGPSGVGKRAAALAWLARGGPERPVRLLPDGATDQDEPPLHATAIAQGELLLLDTTDVAAEAFAGLLPALPEYQQHLHKAGARLAVVLTPAQERHLERSVREAVAHIQPPNPWAVLNRHLRHHNLPPPAELTAETRRWVAQLPAERLADLADLTARARTATPAADPGAWFATAVASMKDLDHDVTALLETHDSSADRAALLAAAMLDGCALETIHAATAALLRQTNSPHDDTPPLERPGFTTRLAALGLTVDRGRRVTFTRITHAPAVRDRFWDDCQPLHSALQRWIQECVADLGLTAEERVRVTQRLAEQSLRVRRVDPLLALAHTWTKDTHPAHALEATQLLTDALADPHAAQTVRQRLYHWATRPEIPRNRAHVITELCVTTLRESHPNQAFVRLRRLARNPNPAVADPARAAILHATGDDPRFRRTALQVLAERTMDQPDRELLYQLALAAGPHTPLPATFREEEAFRGCLHKAMTADADEARRHGLCALDACAAHGRWATATIVIDVALRTGRDHILYATARRWALTEGPSPPEAQRRREIASAVIRRIDQHEFWTEDPL